MLTEAFLVVAAHWRDLRPENWSRPAAAQRKESKGRMLNWEGKAGDLSLPIWPWHRLIGKQLTLNPFAVSALSCLFLEKRASKYLHSDTKCIDRNGAWGVKVGRRGLKWLARPWLLYGIAPKCAADICRRVSARDGREKSRYHPVAMASGRDR